MSNLGSLKGSKFQTNRSTSTPSFARDLRVTCVLAMLKYHIFTPMILIPNMHIIPYSTLPTGRQDKAPNPRDMEENGKPEISTVVRGMQSSMHFSVTDRTRFLRTHNNISGISVKSSCVILPRPNPNGVGSLTGCTNRKTRSTHT